MNDPHSQVKEYYELWREMNWMYEDWAKSFGISYYAFLTLEAVWEDREECSQRKICQKCLLSKQTVNMILKEFQEKGFLYCTSSQTDRRVKLIHLTEKGEKYVGSMVTRVQELEESVMRRMGPDRSEAMLENTRLYVRYFKEGYGGI